MTNVTNNALKTISHKHQAIMVFLIANPEMKLGQVAMHFDVTQPWLSTVIHSDAFQAKFRPMMKDYQGEIFLSLTEKMSAVAHQSLDKLAEELLICHGPDLPLKASIAVLDRLGFGTGGRGASVAVTVPPGGTAVVQISPGILNGALEQRQQLRDIQGEVVHETEATQGLSSSDGSSEDGVDGSTELHSEHESAWPEKGGNRLRSGVPQVGAEAVGKAVQARSLVEILGGGFSGPEVVPE